MKIELNIQHLVADDADPTGTGSILSHELRGEITDAQYSSLGDLGMIVYGVLCADCSHNINLQCAGLNFDFTYFRTDGNDVDYQALVADTTTIFPQNIDLTALPCFNTEIEIDYHSH